MEKEDKYLVKKIKNSMRAGITQSEIRKKLQNKNYKIEYIDELIGKANSKKATIIFVWIILLMIIVIAGGVATYTFFISPEEIVKRNISKPTFSENNENITITSDYITYILSEIGASKLHKNPITRKDAVITFYIDGQNFYSIINNDIKTYEGTIESDIKIITTKQEFVNIILSSNSQEYIKQAVKAGTVQIEVIEQSKTNLIAKGYLDFAKSLGFNP